MTIFQYRASRSVWFLRVVGSISFVCAVLLLVAQKVKIELPIAHDQRFSEMSIWSHRGSSGRGGFAENAPGSVLYAAGEGFRGVELDVFYLPMGDQIMVTHDLETNEPNKRGVPIEEFTFPDNLAVWLDLKNLGKLTNDEIATFVRHVKNLGIARNVIVESVDLLPLRIVDREGLSTSLWLQGGYLTFLPVIKFVVRFAGIDAVSFHRRYFEKVRSHFSGRSLLIFTINEPSVLETLRQSGNVAVVLTDLSCAEAKCR